ncbi:MAG: hypothetical protein HY089_03605 [Ignavibacteriales bacterium]|nr:hypothetical protein [Ignavibacteriales bacterium]
MEILEDARANYRGEHPALFELTIDEIKERFLQKYPDGIPVDEAHKLTEDGGIEKLMNI